MVMNNKDLDSVIQRAHAQQRALTAVGLHNPAQTIHELMVALEDVRATVHFGRYTDARRQAEGDVDPKGY